MKKILIILTAILLTNNQVISQSLPIESINISQANYVSDFLSINEIVKKEYAHIRYKNIKIDSLSKIVVSRIEKLENKKQYMNTLLEYFAELKNSHTGLYIRPYVINCSAKLIEKTMFIDGIEEQAFKDMGVRNDDEIIKIDDIPCN